MSNTVSGALTLAQLSACNMLLEQYTPDRDLGIDVAATARLRRPVRASGLCVLDCFKLHECNGVGPSCRYALKGGTEHVGCCCECLQCIQHAVMYSLMAAVLKIEFAWYVLCWRAEQMLL